MKKCPYCGSELQEGAEFCLYCMRSLSQKEDITPKNGSSKNKIMTVTAVAVIVLVIIAIVCISTRKGEDSFEGDIAHTRQTEESTDRTLYEKETFHETLTTKETTEEETSRVEPETSDESRPMPETEVQTEAPSVSIPKAYEDPVWNVINVDGGIAVTGLASGGGRKFTIPETIGGKTVVAIEFDGSHDKNSWEGVIELTLPKTVKYIGNYVFQNCELEKITLPDGLEYIGEHAFTGASLTELVIPDSVTYIAKSAFYSCQEMTSVTLPSSIESIEASTFFMCYKLSEIYIPPSVTYIDALAFTYCYTLSDVYILGSDVTADIQAFEPDFRETELTIHANDAFIKKHSEYQDDWDAEFAVIP